MTQRLTQQHVLPRTARWSAILVAIAALPTAAIGNVYPTGLGQSSNTLNIGAAESVALSYLLNEDATNVSVSILNASNAVVRTITPGAQVKGAQSVMWDGKDNSNNFVAAGNYSFRVTTTGTTRTAWTQISTDSVLNNFELPRGVAVNKNPNSPYYGRIYISNPRTNPTVAGRTMGDGIYMLNADLSDTGLPGGTGPHTGGVDWTTDTGATGPFRLQVGPDDSVYITDWSDQHGGLWQADPNLSGNFVEVLDSTDRDSLGLNSVHGSISDVLIEGTGANRVIYTADEDFPVAGSIQRYDIGNTATWTDPPSATFFDNSVGWNVNFFNSLARHKDGNIYYSQNRNAGTDFASLIELDQTTGEIVWDSFQLVGIPGIDPDPLRGIQGIAYDPVNDVLALATNITTTGGNIIIFDPSTKSILTQFAFGATTNTDVAFDNVGNLYVGNRSGERVRIWAPPNDGSFVANEFSTESLGPLGSIMVLAAAGVPGDYNGNGTVDAADYVLWRNGGPLQNEVASIGSVTSEDYDAWRARFGNTAGSGTTLSAVPEPAAILIWAIGLGALVAGRRHSG